MQSTIVSRAGEPEPVGAGCFWLLGAGAGAAWKKNEEPEPLGKKSQEPEPKPEPVKISRLLSPLDSSFRALTQPVKWTKTRAIF